MAELRHRIMGYRPLNGTSDWALDFFWSLSDGSPIDNEGHVEVGDQINFPDGLASALQHEAAIEAKRAYLTEHVIPKPGVGLSLGVE